MKKFVSIAVALFFVLIILSDFHYKMLLREWISGAKFTLVSKLVIGGSLILILIKLTENTDFKRKIIPFVLLILCAVISFLIGNESSVNIGTAVYIQAQYLFGLLTIFFFLKHYKDVEWIYLERLIQGLIILNAVLILISYVCDIAIFKTYIARFGYNGLFKSTSEATYFYMFSIILYLKKPQSLIRNLFLLLVIISAVMVGSKTIYFFLIAVAIYFAATAFKNKIRNNNTLSIIVAMVLSCLFLILSFKVFLPMNTRLYALYEKEGLITTFFSLRDIHFMNALDSVKVNFEIVNYLFGGMYYINKTTEMGLVDLFLSFGLIGSGIYIYAILKNLPKTLSTDIKVYLGIIVLAIVLRGNFLYFPSVVYISLAIFALILNMKNKHNLEYYESKNMASFKRSDFRRL